MKKTLSKLDFETYAYDEIGQQTIRISNTLSSIAFVGNKVGLSNDIQNQLTEIAHIGTNIQKLDDYCCTNCVNLSNVNITTNVKIFGEYAFANCSSLTNINIFDNNATPIYSIGQHAFENTNLTSINLDLQGKSYTELSDYEGCVYTDKDAGPFVDSYCFANNKNLKSVKLITSTELAPHMFDGCSELTSVEFANHGSCVGEASFANCTKLQTITFPKNFEMISKKMFSNCEQLLNITIPSDSTKFYNIDDYAFENCPQLTSLTMPVNNITEVECISDKAFANSNIKTIKFNGINGDTLKKYSGYSKIIVPKFSPKEQDNDFKYGVWYGTSDQTTTAAINYAIKNGIPLFVIECSSDCSLCTKLKKNVLATKECNEYINQLPYICIYSHANLKWMWDRYGENGYNRDSIGIPAFIKYWKVNGKRMATGYRSRGVSNVNDIKKFIGTSFDSYVPDQKYKNGNIEVVEKTEVFSGWGLDHDCEIYSSDNVKFTWNAAKNELICNE